MAYNIVSGNQTYNINTLSSGNVTLPYYAGYKDNTNNITGNIYKSTPIDVSIQYISGSNWLTSITSSLDDTAASIKLNYTDATAERSARIFLKGAGLTTSNYIIINQKKPTTVSFYWKCSSGCQPYNNKTLWCNVNHVTQSTNNVIEQQEFDQSEITATLS